MILSNNYSVSNDDLTWIINSWKDAKVFSDNALKFVSDLNLKLQYDIDSNIPISESTNTNMTGFRKASKAMMVYTSILPVYLKDLDSGTIELTIPSADIDLLRTICAESLSWKKEYNEAVNHYKNLQRRYKLNDIKGFVVHTI